MNKDHQQIFNTLSEIVEELAVSAKARESALRVLCLGKDWQSLVDTYEQQVKPQIHQSLHPMRQTIAELLDNASSDLPENWEEIVKRTLDSI